MAVRDLRYGMRSYLKAAEFLLLTAKLYQNRMWSFKLIREQLILSALVWVIRQAKAVNHRSDLSVVTQVWQIRPGFPLEPQAGK